MLRTTTAFMQSVAEPALCILLEFAAGGTLHQDIRRQRKTGHSYESDDVDDPAGDGRELHAREERAASRPVIR